MLQIKISGSKYMVYQAHVCFLTTQDSFYEFFYFFFCLNIMLFLVYTNCIE